ncbi:MAG: endonuclease [Aureispira sp.]
MRNVYLLLLLGGLFSFTMQAQYDHQDILSGQTGTSLLTNLRLNYKPTISASYGTARDNMFRYIYRENDTVTCVYTGLKRYLPSNALSPRALMFDNNSNISVNTEHTYPQSKVLNSAGRSDLHHIFPTRALTNNGRSTLPFDEIAINSVDKWWKDANLSTAPPPTAEQPFYSKQNTNTSFEPRDDHKGNVARAMFYYYTMYKSEADGVDPNYFNQQKNILCQWHLADPVDSLEWVRTSRIAVFQNNRVNPFVMDCTLANRCNYCTQTCSPPNSITRQEDFGLSLLDNAPNPVSTQTQLSYQLERTQEVTLRIHNHLGQIVKTVVVAEEQPAGHYSYALEVSNLPDGLYIYSITIGQAGRSGTFSKTMIVAK